MAAVQDSLNDRRLLSAMCRALMALDQPKDLTGEEREALSQYADEQAKVQGFEGWVDAFHKIGGVS